MTKKTVHFEKLPIAKFYGNPIYDVWHLVEDSEPLVLKDFNSLDKATRTKVRRIIGNMATIPEYDSNSLRWMVHKYQYGEVKPKGHRFFFFIKCGMNIVFFEYREKKSDSLGNEVYKMIDQKREEYEREFEKFIKRNQ
ncbi:MAG: hypothetical protein KAU06_06445 [Candidatus Marinimicrobia bacterium]|nr:hypothetical protein [Candidatus Neomarinimicrobiota bacterium]